MTAPSPEAAARRRGIVALLVAGVAGFALSAPVWVRAAAPGVLEEHVPVLVRGAQAAPGVGAAALVLLAAGLALALVGRVGRWVVAGVTVLAGVGVVASALAVLASPSTSAREAALEQHGVGELVGAAHPGLVVYGAVVYGVVVLAVAGTLVRSVRYWPAVSRRHEIVPTGEVTASPRRIDPDDAHGAWDALSRGDDPT